MYQSNVLYLPVSEHCNQRKSFCKNYVHKKIKMKFLLWKRFLSFAKILFLLFFKLSWVHFISLTLLKKIDFASYPLSITFQEHRYNTHLLNSLTLFIHKIKEEKNEKKIEWQNLYSWCCLGDKHNLFSVHLPLFSGHFIWMESSL